ncbi:MAG: CoA transferase [Bacteroidetes bacterium]|jgi:crotonobetainyl-CoA:carnitine CoA-transferase CaiB-like acyl-CoA transferase|nr:CoA transferase [Bacteroidota bacterium]
MLSDLVVLELASVLAGPSVGQFFAELGATVIKVENPHTQGDVTRRWTLPGETPADDRSAYFCCCNYGKQSLALDLGVAAGQEVLHTLVSDADIVIASYRPGTAENLGADAATLCALNPALLYGHITGYGPDNPRAGYDAIIQAESGFMAMNGAPDGPPTKLPVALMDVLAAHQLKQALLVGLLQRTTTGRGGYFPVSLMQAAVSGLANQATNYLVAGHVPQRMGSAHPNIAPYGTPYATGDGGEVILAVGTDRQFAALCRVLDVPALASDARFATNAARVEHRAALDEVLRRAIGAQERTPLLEALQARHVPAGAVRTLPDVFADAHVEPMVHQAAEAEAPAGLRQLPPATFAPDTPLRPPPRYGADTAAVLRTYAGLDADSISELVRAGVVEERGR